MTCPGRSLERQILFFIALSPAPPSIETFPPLSRSPPGHVSITMAADMSGEQMQAKITTARREAEGLKDKIKRRKDELADTICKVFP